MAMSKSGQSIDQMAMRASARLGAARRLTRGLLFISAFLILANASRAGDAKSIKRFRDAMVALAPDVDPHEAALLSVTAHTTARRLAREYRVVGPAVFQDFLIHIGVRQRGYCFQWAHDIGKRLKELRPKTLVLHWGATGAGTGLEHNCVVVTARGQPFRDGFLIDGWRTAGRLCWWPVSKDGTTVWNEDLRETVWLQNYGPSRPKPGRATTHRNAALPSVVINSGSRE